jgi:hypothetical protein
MFEEFCAMLGDRIELEGFVVVLVFVAILGFVVICCFSFAVVVFQHY